MSFMWPAMLVSLGLVPLGVAAWLVIERRRQARAAAMGGLGLRASGRTRGGRVRERIPALLFLAAMVVLAVAMARPQAAVSLPRSEGIVMLTVDVSGSMAAADVAPSRMEVARDVARRLVEARPDGVVVGVVAFSDDGLAVQEPTADGAALEQAIERLGPASGTSLGRGIDAALDAIEAMEAGTPPETYSDRSPEPTVAPEPLEPGSREAAAIVLLSDGENTGPPAPLQAARTAADAGVRVHTIGVGTLAGTTLEVDGFVIHTQLDEALLARISALTGGTSLALDADAEEAGDSIDPADVYGSLGRQLTARAEPMEVTSLFAGAGVLLLLAGAMTSLVVTGRLT